jgi:hypothetical protein
MSEKVKEIIKRIENYLGEFPKADLEYLIENKEEATPFLLDELRDAQKVIQKLRENESYFFPFYAFYLLAQFREKEAYPLIYQILTQKDIGEDDSFGDFVTEDLQRVLASVSNGDTSLINKLIEDDAVYEYVRSAGIDAWVTLYQNGDKSREEIIDYFGYLLRQPTEPQSYIRASMVCGCLDIKAKELLPEIKENFDNDLVDESIIDWKFAEEGILEKNDYVDYNTHKYITDAIGELGDWLIFDDEEDMPEKTTSPAIPKFAWQEQSGTYIRPTPKVGKNEPCPCGSGRKYKKCCMN